MNSIYSYSKKDLEKALALIGEKPFRATQIFEWLYKKNVTSFFEMTNISKTSQELLNSNFSFNTIEPIDIQKSSDGTKKYLFKLNDGNAIEAVLMRHDYGNSVCVSSQVGCNMKCAFCASGKHGKIRNLTVDEMVLEVLFIAKDLEKEDERLSHVVIMGIGEPFENYDNVLNFIRVINDPKGLEIGQRHITLSTCGLVPRIYDFAEFELQVNLAISLHFPNDELRSKYMPINKAYNLSELFKALRYYFDKTSRRITFEYILLDKINDTKECLNELIKLVKGLTCYINLIPMNETGGEFKRSKKENAVLFRDGLLAAGIGCTIRKERGGDIDAACGQLRNKKGLQ